MSFPTTMSGFDRTYQPPRSLRGELGASVTAWELLQIRGAGEEWANATLDGIVASIEAAATESLGCVECGDLGFYGVVDSADDDLLTGLVRSSGAESFEVLTAAGEWRSAPAMSDARLEVLSLDLAADLAEAITSGACGLLRRYSDPVAWINPCAVVAAAPLGELLSALICPGPQENTDGKWVNFAVVDEVDQGAVLDLVRISASGQLAERRVGSAWTPDEDLLVKADLPMVRLDGIQLAEVQAQVDSAMVAAVEDHLPAKQKCEYCSAQATRRILHSEGMAYIPVCDQHLTKGKNDAAHSTPDGTEDESNIDWIHDMDGKVVAAGLVADAPLTVSPDPRAEKLRRYWSTGRGALKIRWGLPGDARRCHRHLEKYMPGRAWAYCNNLHKRNNGFWTGDRRNRGVRGSALHVAPRALGSIAGYADPRPVGAVPHIFRVGQVVKISPAPPGAPPVSPLVAALVGEFEVVGIDVPPVIAPVTAGARRIEVVQDVIQLRALGYWTSMGNPGRAMSEPVAEAGGGVAVAVAIEGAGPPPPTIGQDVVVRLELAHDERRRAGLLEAPVVQLAHPALQAAGDALGKIDATTHEFYCTHPTCGFVDVHASPEEALLASLQARRWVRENGRNYDMTDTLAIADGIYTEADPANGGIMNTLLAGGFPVKPPKAWFDKPELTGPTPLDVTDEGRVYGHIAPWGVSHIGMAGSVVTPKNPDGKYAYFRTGALRTEEGVDVHVGQLTLVGGHAPISATAAQAVKHYDDTNSAVADVVVGEDQYGVWAAGALRPNVTPEQVRAMRACPPSGDWRPVNGRLELVAACHVNVQGFPIAKALYASGAVTALVAAGARQMYELRAAQVGEPVLAAKVAELQVLVASLQASAATATLEQTAEPVVELAAPEPVAEQVDDDSGEIITAEIIDDAGDVEMTAEELARAERISKARDMIGDIKREQLRARVRSSGAPVTAALPPQFLANKKGGDGKKKPKGEQSLPDGSFPISDVASLKNAIQAFGRSKNPDAAKKHIKSMANRLKRPDLIPSNWK